MLACMVGEPNTGGPADPLASPDVDNQVDSIDIPLSLLAGGGASPLLALLLVLASEVCELPSERSCERRAPKEGKLAKRRGVLGPATGIIEVAVTDGGSCPDAGLDDGPALATLDEGASSMSSELCTVCLRHCAVLPHREIPARRCKEEPASRKVTFQIVTISTSGTKHTVMGDIDDEMHDSSHVFSFLGS